MDAALARLVPNEEVAQNAYNLSVSNYVENKDTLEEVDIQALMQKLYVLWKM